MRVLPETQRNWQRIDVELLPPCGLITRAMKFAVMDPANRDGELVAHSVSKRTRLGKREVMRIRRRAAAHKTSLQLHELPVVLVAQTDRFTQSMDHPAARSFAGHHRSFLAGVRVRSADGRNQTIGCRDRCRPARRLPIADREKVRLKR